MKFVDFMERNWQLYPLQIIGAALLIPAFVIAIMAARADSIETAYIALTVLTIIALIDFYIIWQAKRQNIQTVTVTRWVRNLLPKKWDNIVMFVFISLVWWLTGPLYALFYIHGFLNDHFNEDR